MDEIERTDFHSVRVWRAEQPEGEVESAYGLCRDEESARRCAAALWGGAPDDWRTHLDVRNVRAAYINDMPSEQREALLRDGFTTIVSPPRRAPKRGPMLTCADLYARTPARTTTQLWELLANRASHVPEVESHLLPTEVVEGGLQDRIEIRHLRDGFDVTLATVWFDRCPVMVIQAAGDDRDFSAEYVTDRKAYSEMVRYLRSLYEPGDPRVVDPDAPMRELTSFFGIPDVLNRESR